MVSTVPSGLATQVGLSGPITVTFSEQMDATTFCSAWTNSGTQTLTNAVVVINNVAVTEGNSGSAAASFTVSFDDSGRP